MERVINFCGNCPFKVVMGEDIAICKLSKFEKKEDFQLDVESLETPDWCLLKEELYIFKFRKFSDERQGDIDDINSEIIKLKEFGAQKEEIIELYNELDKLTDNENLADLEEEFDIDISDQIDDIKTNLIELEKAGERLKKAFSDASKKMDEDE